MRRSRKQLHGLGALGALSNRRKGILYGTGFGALMSLGIWLLFFRETPMAKAGKAPGFDADEG